MMTPESSPKIICKKIHYHFCFTRVLVENVVVLVYFGTFRSITFYVSIESENFLTRVVYLVELHRLI